MCIRDRLERYLGRRLPVSIDWAGVNGLSRETVDKLNKYRPSSLGRALDAGVSPSDALVILALLRGGKLSSENTVSQSDA